MGIETPKAKCVGKLRMEIRITVAKGCLGVSYQQGKWEMKHGGQSLSSLSLGKQSRPASWSSALSGKQGLYLQHRLPPVHSLTPLSAWDTLFPARALVGGRAMPGSLLGYWGFESKSSFFQSLSP